MEERFTSTCRNRSCVVYKGEVALIATACVAASQALATAWTFEVTLGVMVRTKQKLPGQYLLIMLTPFFLFRHVEQPLDLPGTPTMVTETEGDSREVSAFVHRFDARCDPDIHQGAGNITALAPR
jgi:hypothetical protein